MPDGQLASLQAGFDRIWQREQFLWRNQPHLAVTGVLILEALLGDTDFYWVWGRTGNWLNPGLVPLLLWGAEREKTCVMGAFGLFMRGPPSLPSSLGCDETSRSRLRCALAQQVGAPSRRDKLGTMTFFAQIFYLYKPLLIDTGAIWPGKERRGGANEEWQGLPKAVEI